ncbi:hypothetical protein MPSEU_000140000 [Mayamaea pseudoterrestris]|nr:hypothetical protein MPSEU_000140000 [Mayamaea pseudoterrestris]
MANATNLDMSTSPRLETVALLSLMTTTRDNGTFHRVRPDEQDLNDSCVVNDDSNDDEPHSPASEQLDYLDDEDLHKTTFWQTYVHLLKGYIGCGVLSLPWAVSQLGIPFGIVAIFIMAIWSSYNCWTVVKLKRYIEQSNSSNSNTSSFQVNNSPRLEAPSDTRSEGAASSTITYPDVGDWAYGSSFHKYVTACIITQQLAICTVFMSFIGENIHAVLQFVNITSVTHYQILSVIVPPVMLLCFLPTLKHLAPVMVIGTLLIMIGFACLAGVGWLEWEDRPLHAPPMHFGKAPLALCAILYSFEGICLVLPVETAMRDPQEFQKAFVWSMSTVAAILAVVAGLSVAAFGYVLNGSITAFLLQEYGDDPSHTFYLMLVNTAVSLSILLTYPLQLFPALELVAPIIERYQPRWIKGEIDDDLDLVSFEPLPPIDEHDVMSIASLPSHHDYANSGVKADDDDENDSITAATANGELSSRDRWRIFRRLLPQMVVPGDSLLLRASLVMLTYAIASLVPNVENLISLAGAVAGSSTALLIPPILELAWIAQLQKGDASVNHSAAEFDDSRNWILATGRADKFFFEKLKSWTLLILGLIFAALGTYASVSDIIRLYRGA